jgi:hypothetical protein
MIDGNRVCDVLELLGTVLDEADAGELAADLLVDFR